MRTMWTAAPWHVVPLSIGNIANADGSVQVGMASQVAADDRDTDHATRRANAQIMACAPELYEALESMLGVAKAEERDLEPRWVAAIIQSEATLAKARGEGQ